jgi:hypothetical protein
MAEVISLAKMGSTAHLHHHGGRPNKYAKKEAAKPGMFNVDEYNCWLIGIKGNERDITISPYNKQVRRYPIPKGNSAKRYF